MRKIHDLLSSLARIISVFILCSEQLLTIYRISSIITMFVYFFERLFVCMQIKLSDHFTYGRIIRFTLPSIAMMIFTSIYGVVDGFFVSNYVGKTPFAAVNFIYPFLMILGAFGFMLGTGGNALVAKTLGEGDEKRANEIFSLMIYVSIVCGILITVLGIIFIRPIASLLGAEGEMLENCVLYGRIILLSMTPFMLQIEFQSFFITAERPNLGLVVTLASGITNMVLDFLLVGLFPLGLVGAALATALSQAVGGFLSLAFFVKPGEKTRLKLTKTHFDGKVLLKASVNGSSELMSNIAMSLVGMLYNVQLLRFAGEDGVAAYGVMMYVTMIFISIFIGYSIGTAPLIGYNFGAGNHAELKNLLGKSFWIIGTASVCMLLLSFGLAAPLSRLFVGYDEVLFEMTKQGFFIYSFSFLFCGVAIFGSSFFTALNNGLISALISFLRTLVFQVAAVIVLPLIWELDGIWYSCVVAELMAFVVTLLFIVAQKKKYHY